MSYSFDFVTSLQYQNRHLKRQVESFKSGEAYVKLREKHKVEIRALEAENNRCKKLLAAANRSIIANRNHWMEVNKDVIKEKERELKKKDTELENMQAKLYDMARQRDDALDEIRKLKAELYAVKSALLEEQEKRNGLIAKLHTDYTNSSLPSSSNPNHDKILNSRVKTGRTRGGQPGHEHHPRKVHTPGKVVQIPPKEEYLDTEKFKPTGRIISKQLVGMRMVLDVVEFQTPEYRNVITGQRVHAEFPDGLRDDVTYDGTVKAAAYLLNDTCNVSIKNTCRFFSELTDGELNLSTGLVSKLQKEFADKTESDRIEIFKELVSSPTMHVDYTFGRCDGKIAAVLICANEDVCLYMSRPKKGDEGVKGSPLEFYSGTVIHDHESALRHYGSRHQECMTHIERYARGSVENEPGRKWASMLLKWISEAIHFRNTTLQEGGVYDEKKVAMLLSRYDDIMKKAKEEYENEPPSRYYRKGYNLFKRMSEEKEDYVLFLHDISVEPTNNRAERLARQFKRKNHQVMTFRSDRGISKYCDGLSLIQSIRESKENIYQTSVEVFNRPGN